MACPTPPLDLPLHSDLRILAQCGRDFLCQAHQKATHSRRLPIRRRSQGRHQPLRPGNQCRTKTLHLDRRSQPRPRRCQTRETSVRVDPLGVRITVRIPISIRKRGGRKLVLAPDGTTDTWTAPNRRIDYAMVKAVARTFRWREMLENGTYATIAEIAAAEKINESYVGRVLRLTFLARQS